MKLRIHNNSIRFRLSRSEVEKLATEGRVEVSVRFTPTPSDSLIYALETSPSCQEIRAQRTSNEICVTLPTNLAQTWVTSDQVGIEHLQPIGGESGLHILIEKDFRCLHGNPVAQEDDVGDLYPNPNDAVSSVE